MCVMALRCLSVARCSRDRRCNALYKIIVVADRDGWLGLQGMRRPMARHGRTLPEMIAKVLSQCCQFWPLQSHERKRPQATR